MKHYSLPWIFEHEHYFHIATGSAFFLGGLIEVLRRKKILRRKFWCLGLPLGLAGGGALFLHPQHGTGDVLNYMTIYHQVLSVGLIVAGVLLALINCLKLKPAKFKKLYPWVLLIVTIPALTFLAYRHQYNAEAMCRQLGKTHRIKVSAEGSQPSNLEVTLCDNVQFISTDKKSYHIFFSQDAQHHDHQAGPGFINVPEDGKPGQFNVPLSGTFEYTEHYNTKVRGSVTVKRPENLRNWVVEKR